MESETRKERSSVARCFNFGESRGLTRVGEIMSAMRDSISGPPRREMIAVGRIVETRDLNTNDDTSRLKNSCQYVQKEKSDELNPYN